VSPESNLPPWWARPDLDYRRGRLHFQNTDLPATVSESGTPAFLYSADRMSANLQRLDQALSGRSVPHRIYYAMKANRFPPLLAHLRSLGSFGVDVCSPGELRLALQTGFEPSEIVFTGTCLSDRDLEILAAHPEVLINCDSLSVIRRLGKLCPGRSIGLRINPQLGFGYTHALVYSGETPTKFGIYAGRFEEALELAAGSDLHVAGLHFHCGSGLLGSQQDIMQGLLDKAAWFLDRCPQARSLDIGGGLGIPMASGDQPLDLQAWSRTIADFAAPRRLTILLEPGDYAVKDAGILLVKVTMVEEKGGVTFVGVDAGYNIQNLRVFYDLPFVIVPLEISPETQWRTVTVAGNINEALDLWAENIPLPASLGEGDVLAILNVGGYGSASASNHCLRGEFGEVLL